jgi:arylsulfatase A-like enzyme
LLQRALGYVDDQLAAMVNGLRSRGMLGSTAIVVSAKHGQSPQNPNDLTRIDDGPIIAGINAAWKQSRPSAGDLVAGGTDDDAIMLWLSDRSEAAAQFVQGYLLSHSATGNTGDGGSRTLAASGLSKVYAGNAAARYFGVPASDPRHPDVWGVVQHGVLYTGGTGKIAEHGGADREDRDVPIVLYAPGAVSPRTWGTRLETTSIAPTILKLLGLDPRALEAVQEEHTPALPGVR